MKRALLIILIGILTGYGYLAAQDQPISPTFTTTGVFLGETPALKDLPPLSSEEFHQLELKGEQKALNPKLKERHYPYASNALPNGPDPVWQKEMGKTETMKAPIVNFSGQTSPYYPPDCNGAAGPNHYMQTINTVYTIYDKNSGALLAGPTALNTLFNGVTGSQYNDGDPICLYDEQADRWLVAEFSVSGSNDYMLIAVSTTNDPTGTWYAYTFDVADMPDYEKFGIWQDGYYMGTNTSNAADIYVFERVAMLNGQTAKAVGFDNSWRPTTIDGFMCVPPVDNDGAFAPAGSPGLFITINDDAIGGGNDELWIYELDVDWGNLSSSTFNRVQQLTVPSFDSNFGNNWDNIKQPGTNRELDAIPMVIMNVPQYRNFGSYQTLVCCHTVDVDATDHAGIRWYELRKTDGSWILRQSGTYAPDEHSRWMGSVAMNGSGEIGMGYSISSNTVYPGIRYCGQSQAANAAMNGVMDIAEEIIQNGSSSQTAYNRWGDYSNICIDPVDDHTFWFTTQYGGSRQTKIAAFAFSTASLTAEFSGTPTTVCPGGTVTFNDLSLGSPISWNWSFPGGTPSTSTSQNPVITYNSPGVYDVTLTVYDASGNDTQTKTGYITVTTILADFTGSATMVTLGETVNFTDLSSCNASSWSWTFPGGTPSSSTAQNPSVVYNLAGTYSVTLQATNAQGSDIETKVDYITVTDMPMGYCSSQGNNSSYEYIGGVQFNDFTNSSGASSYTDYTSLVVPMTAGGNVNVTLTPVFPGSVYSEWWRVWIDFNRDGDFEDANELVFAYDASTTVVNGNFTLPSGVSGTTRMRVSMKWDAAPTPCETFSYGEVEDYAVTFGTPQPPVADFNASTTTILEGQSVNFYDLSTNGPTSWAWTFTGGTPSGSTIQNPTVTYSNAGTYNVSLIATNAAGSDTETKINYITVLAVPSCVNAIAPLDGASGVLVSSELSWTSDADATGYTLYFGTNNPPTNLVNGSNLGNVTSYDPAGDMDYGTTYYWRIVPYNSNGSASGCPVWSFTTENNLSGSVELSYTDFEAAFGIWTDGGGDCSLYTKGTYASSGKKSANIQDNSDVQSSFYSTYGTDVSTPGYTQIDVEFEFIAVSMENNEDFWLQYYDGSAWQTVASYAYPAQFNNNTFYRANFSIRESQYTFPTDMLLRFMCDASDNGDDIYIDNVRVTAYYQENPSNYIIPLSGPIGDVLSNELDQNSEIKVYPNPAFDVLNVEVQQNELAEIYIHDMQGRVVAHLFMRDDHQEISLEQFRTGMYSILVITREDFLRTKFIKK